MELKALILCSLIRGDMLFLSEDSDSLCHCWCLSCYMCDMSFAGKVFVGNIKDRKRDWAWDIFIRSSIVDKRDIWRMVLAKALLDVPYIHRKHLFWSSSTTLIWKAVGWLKNTMYKNKTIGHKWTSSLLNISLSTNHALNFIFIRKHRNYRWYNFSNISSDTKTISGELWIKIKKKNMEW